MTHRSCVWRYRCKVLPDTFTPYRFDTPPRACYTRTSFLGRYYGGHVLLKHLIFSAQLPFLPSESKFLAGICLESVGNLSWFCSTYCTRVQGEEQTAIECMSPCSNCPPSISRRCAGLLARGCCARPMAAGWRGHRDHVVCLRCRSRSVRPAAAPGAGG